MQGRAIYFHSSPLPIPTSGTMFLGSWLIENKWKSDVQPSMTPTCLMPPLETTQKTECSNCFYMKTTCIIATYIRDSELSAEGTANVKPGFLAPHMHPSCHVHGPTMAMILFHCQSIMLQITSCWESQVSRVLLCSCPICRHPTGLCLANGGKGCWTW